MTAPMIVRFWGTRGSIPTPGHKTRRYGGNTSCVAVEIGDRLAAEPPGTLVGSGATIGGYLTTARPDGYLQIELGLGDTLVVQPEGPISLSLAYPSEPMGWYPLDEPWLVSEAGRYTVRVSAFVLSAGVITAIPLVLFAYGAQRIRMTTLGLLQYLAPSVQFLIGLFIYREPFDSARLQAFALIWIGLIVYTADTFWVQRRTLLKVVQA